MIPQIHIDFETRLGPSTVTLLVKVLIKNILLLFKLHKLKSFSLI